MVHTLEEIRTCTPATRNEAAPEAAMLQAAWQALLRDVVQGLHPPHTPATLRRWLQTTPRHGPSAPHRPPQPDHHHTGKGKGKDKGRARGGKGHPGEGVRRGPR